MDHWYTKYTPKKAPARRRTVGVLVSIDGMRLLVDSFIATGQQKQTDQTSAIVDVMSWLGQQTKNENTTHE